MRRSVTQEEWIEAIFVAEECCYQRVRRVPIERDGYMIDSDTRQWDLAPEDDYPLHVARWRRGESRDIAAD
ncbi:MAG: hypothetical protein M3440_08530 [Chloroflexota bacterium]|nr:hypothetical protein [Chloroflexota bacterium]